MATDYKKELDDFISTVIKESGSDLHLSENRNPTIRVAGSLIPIIKSSKLSKSDMEGIIDQFLNADNKKKFLEERQIDFAYNHHSSARFRGNAYFQQGMVSIALRFIPQKIKTIQDLNLPAILATFAQKQQGFFLVVGPAGQGKSTTLAAIIEMINTERLEHIVTIEDPIEYIFTPKKSIIDQREIRVDAPDFQTALWAVFRQDIDVVMIGEMRQPETMSTAVTAAETGHMVFSTLHTNSASQTVERIIDSFPAEQQSQIRFQLAGSLLGIFSQRLIPRISGGLIPAYELLINNPAVANVIRDKRTHEINTIIETSSAEGMIDLNRSLIDLVRSGEITIENAYKYSTNPKVLEKLL